MQLVVAKPAHKSLDTSSIVSDVSARDAHLKVRDLYLECLSHVLVEGAFEFHVLINPDMTGDHVVFCGDDRDLAAEVEALTGEYVGHMDCVVVLGRQVLDGNLTEDDMAALVAGDLSNHIGRIWPVADRSVGWCGKQIGWSALAGMLVSAHPILSAMPISGSGQRLHDRIRDVAAAHMRAAMYPGNDGMERLKRENAPALEAVDRLLVASRETSGGYISLPASLVDLVEAGKRLVSNVLDDMDVRPSGIV